MVTALVFPESGKYVAAIKSDGHITVCGAEGKEVMYSAMMAPCDLKGTVAAARGDVVAFASQSGAVSVHDIGTHCSVTRDALIPILKSVGLGADGKIYLVGNQQIVLLERWTLNVIARHLCDEYFGLNVAVDMNEMLLATTSFWGNLRIWNIKSSKPVMQLAADISEGSVISFANGIVACAAGTFGIRVWNLRTGAQDRLDTGVGVVIAIAISADGRLLAAVDHLGNLRAWNTGSGHLVLSVSIDRSLDCVVAVSANGVVAASEHGSIQMFRVNKDSDSNGTAGWWD